MLKYKITEKIIQRTFIAQYHIDSIIKGTAISSNVEIINKILKNILDLLTIKITINFKITRKDNNIIMYKKGKQNNWKAQIVFFVEKIIYGK